MEKFPKSLIKVLMHHSSEDMRTYAQVIDEGLTFSPIGTLEPGGLEYVAKFQNLAPQCILNTALLCTFLKSYLKSIEIFRKYIKAEFGYPENSFSSDVIL